MYSLHCVLPRTRSKQLSFNPQVVASSAEMLLVLLLGMIAGFIGSIPVAGPVAVLVLRSALAAKRRAAMQIAFGSAVAEAVYGGFAFMGIGALVGRYPMFIPISGFVGAAVLIAVGVVLMVKKPSVDDPGMKAKAASKWLLGFSVTALNPTIIVSWSAVITTMHGMNIISARAIDALPFGLGIGAGVVGWFYALLWLVGRHRARLPDKAVHRGVQLIGALLVLGGLAMGVTRAISFWGSGPA